jgi:hypothetical protein
MASPEVDEFAKLLITHVRDMAVAGCDMSLRTDSNDAMAERWREKMRTGKVGALASEMIPDCVDDTLFYLLNAIDQGLLRMSFTTRAGKTVDLTEVGESEMSGWYMATNGWRSAYSKERFNDDFADLA